MLNRSDRHKVRCCYFAQTPSHAATVHPPGTLIVRPWFSWTRNRVYNSLSIAAAA